MSHGQVYIPNDMNEYTITMQNGTRYGGRYENREAVERSYANSLTPVARIEQRPLFTPEEVEQMRQEKILYYSRH